MQQMDSFISYNGGKIHFCDEGKGDAIVLIHGYLESAEIWSGMAYKLSKGYRVITVDLPGHGRSDNCSADYTMEFLAELIKELLDKLNIRKAFITGHSLGGYVTLAFLEKYPDRLSGYCLFHSQPFADTIAATEKRKREIRIVSAGKKDLVYSENVTRMFADCNLSKFPDALLKSRKIASQITPEGIVAVLKGMIKRPARLSVMEDGRVPCLWILGSMDNYIPCSEIQDMVNLPDNAAVVVLKNSGHLGFIEEEERTLEVIKGFVEGLKC
jgi:pimeloyl-ACP methyl ester carboxylesterase